MIGIIGGSGFIGSRLFNRLNTKKNECCIIDKNNSSFYADFTTITDIRDYKVLKESLEEVDIVVNLAAEHRDDVSPISLYDEVNVDGAKNVCKACEELGIQKIVFTSTVAVYGFAPKGTDEKGEINYFNDYGRTKWEAENVYKEWFNKDTENRSLIIIRPTVVFGERNRGNVYNLLKQIASGIFPMVGNGRNVKSMAYVENVAAFIQYSVEELKGFHLFNYIDKPDFSMNELVLHVKKVLGKRGGTGIHWPYWLGMAGGLLFDILSWISRKKLPVSRIRIKKFCSDTKFEPVNISKTDFRPPVSISDAISNTLTYEFLNKKDPNEVLFYSE